jgi:hypothetical protein
MHLEDVIRALQSGVRVQIQQPEEPKLNPAEQALKEALLGVVAKHGTFDESGCGIWAAYDPAISNEVQNIGVMCDNCVMYQGGNKCRIVNLPDKIEAKGKCRFAVIPDGIVKASG